VLCQFTVKLLTVKRVGFRCVVFLVYFVSKIFSLRLAAKPLDLQRNFAPSPCLVLLSPDLFVCPTHGKFCVLGVSVESAADAAGVGVERSRRADK